MEKSGVSPDFSFGIDKNGILWYNAVWKQYDGRGI